MNKSFRIVIALVLLVPVVLIYIHFANSRVKPDQSGNVLAASIAPIADIVKNVSGDNFTVVQILPSGGSPHTFEPSPRMIEQVQNADAVYFIGHGLDDWVFDLSSNSNVLLDKNIQLLNSSDGELDDPHYWLSVANAKIIAKTIAEDLMNKYPDMEDEIQSNLDNYTSELVKLDQSIKLQLSNLENKNLIVFHDAWYYFAKEYGLNLLASFEPTAGREPTPKYLSDLSKSIIENNLETVYTEVQFSSEGISSFAKDNQLQILTLDPLGGIDGRESYIDLMNYNASQISKNK